MQLMCTVHGCRAPLARSAGALVCARGHAFDLARSGYCNLLQPQDRRSSAPGDAPAAVEARQRWLRRGLADALLAALDDEVAGLALCAGSAVVDVGCGDGSLLDRLAARHGFAVCGIDLASTAIRAAARRRPAATWIVANADRTLPFVDASVDLLLSVFGPRNGPEFARVLRPGAHLLAAVPAADDLIELREAVLGAGCAIERADRLAVALEPWFGVVGRHAVREQATLGAAEIRDALAMTYRGARQQERERADALADLAVTLSAELLLFRRCAGGSW